MPAGKAETSISALIAETTFNVRYAETDAMGIVHHSAYVIWMEEGRSAWFRKRLNDIRGYALMESDGYALAVTGINMRFLAAARYGDRVCIRTWVTSIRSRSITVAYEIMNAESGVCLVTAQSTHMCVDKGLRVVAMPPYWLDRLNPGTDGH